VWKNALPPGEGEVKNHPFEKRRHNEKGVVHKRGEISTEINGFSTKLCHLEVM
jgi:hypothetical protein